jgi:hypothetical protein
MGREFRYDLAEVLHKDEERVGFLTREDDIEIEIWRFLSFVEQKVNYWALNLDTGECFNFKTIDKTKRTKRGRYFTPSDVEDWISKKRREGYELELRVWNVGQYELRRTIGGIPQRVWYENFLRFFETEQSKPVVWYTYDDLRQFRLSFWIPEDEWPDYWALIMWERSHLLSRFKYFIHAIWFWALGIIYKLAKQMEKHKGSIAREKPFQVVMEFMEKDDPIKIIQHILEAELKNYGKERYDKEQIDWLSSIVWQKLLEATKENRSMTLDEIRINLERGEKLFYNPLRGRSTFLS